MPIVRIRTKPLRRTAESYEPLKPAAATRPPLPYERLNMTPPPPPPEYGAKRQGPVSPREWSSLSEEEWREIFTSDGRFYPILSGDLLSDLSRRQRRWLMSVSVIAVTVVATGLLPSKIAALGIEFGAADRHALLYMFVVLILYYTAAFGIYAAGDVLKLIIALGTALGELRQHAEVADRSVEVTPAPNAAVFDLMALPVAVVRGLFEFLLPFIIAAIAAITAFSGVVPFSSDITKFVHEASAALAEWLQGGH